jgi:hypothetical protein
LSRRGPILRRSPLRAAVARLTYSGEAWNITGMCSPPRFAAGPLAFCAEPIVFTALGDKPFVVP